VQVQLWFSVQTWRVDCTMLTPPKYQNRTKWIWVKFCLNWT